MNQEGVLWVALCFLIAGHLTLSTMMRKQRIDLRCLDIKLDALLKAQGVEWPLLSPEVQALALDPNQKIAAIKLHREKNPGIGLAEAKTEIESFARRSVKLPIG